MVTDTADVLLLPPLLLLKPPEVAATATPPATAATVIATIRTVEMPAPAATAAALMGTVPVNIPPGTAAETLKLTELPAVIDRDPLVAIPEALVVTTELRAPLPNVAPLPYCGSKNVTVIPGTGTLLVSVTWTTASALTRPFLTRLEVPGLSRIVNLYFCTAFGWAGWLASWA